MKVWLPSSSFLESLKGFEDEIQVVNSEKGIPDLIEDVEFLVPPMFEIRSEIEALIPKMKSLRVIHSLSAGVEDLLPHVRQGVKLCNSTDAHHTSTAEMAVALTLASLRGISHFSREYDWQLRTQQIWQSLADSKVLIIGYGSVGAAIERRLSGFECEVVRVARHAREGVYGVAELDQLLPLCDVVILCTPFTVETENLANKNFFAHMKQGALFVNVSRGPIANTNDLVDAIQTGHIRAALDVTEPEPLPSEHPLLNLPNVLLTPHVAGRSTALQSRLNDLICAQVKRYLTGEPLKNVISGLY
jgi:phosphoglycerate dehydrogenase-like enzyme